MQEDGVEYESFTIISIDSLLIYGNKYYLQALLDNCAYRIVEKLMTNYLDDNLVETNVDYLFDKRFPYMLYYDRIDLSKKCIVCHYWFFNHAFKLQSSVCNGSHDWIMLCLKVMR